MTLIRRKGCLVRKPKQPGHEYTEHTFTGDFTVAASRIHGRFGYSSKSMIVLGCFTSSQGKFDWTRGKNFNLRK